MGDTEAKRRVEDLIKKPEGFLPNTREMRLLAETCVDLMDRVEKLERDQHTHPGQEQRYG